MRLLAALLLLSVAPIAYASPLLEFPDDPPAIEVRGLSAAPVITLRYGDALDPATLKVVLNDEVVSAAFAPAAGRTETVELPFVPGRNRLEFEVWSTVRGDAEPVREYRVREITYARLPTDDKAASRLKSLPELRKERWEAETPEAERTPPPPPPAPEPAAPPP
jgi:hypothetical protein